MDFEELLVELVSAIAGVSAEQAQGAFDASVADPFWGGLWSITDGLWNLLFGIGSAVVGIFELLLQLVGDLPYIIAVVGDFLGSVPLYFSWLPSEVVSLLCAIFGVVATYMIMGRK